PGDLPWAAASWVRAGDTGDRAMAIVVVLQVGGRRTEPGKGDRIARGAKERRSRLDRRGDRAATGGGRRSGPAATEATVCPDGARTGARYGAPSAGTVRAGLDCDRPAHPHGPRHPPARPIPADLSAAQGQEQ